MTQPSSTTLRGTPGLPSSVLQTIAESQASLNRASSAIEAAYERLLALRTRLDENSEAMSLLTETAPTPRMGPNHSAIVLSGAQPSSTPNGDETSDSMVVDAMPQQPETAETEALRMSAARTIDTIRRRFQELAGTDRSAPALPDMALYERPDTSQSARPAPGYVLRPATTRANVPAEGRRTQLTPHVWARRDMNPNDPTTSLGRRVEARAAAAARNEPRNPEDTAARILELRSSIDGYISRLNRHGEELLAAANSLRREPPPAARSPTRTPLPTLPAVTGANRRLVTSDELRREFDSVISRAQDDMNVRSWTSTPPAPEYTFSATVPMGNPSDQPEEIPMLRAVDTSAPGRQRIWQRNRRRLDASRNATNVLDVSDSEEEDELDWLLGDRTRRIQPPTVGLSSERHRSDMLGRARAALLTSRASERAYYENAAMQPRSSIGRTSTPSYERFQEQFELALTNSQASGPTNVDTVRPRRRRRGWGTCCGMHFSIVTLITTLAARLDRDGNEIPTDEEEEYERHRAHMRIRAQVLASGNTSALTSTEAITLPPPPPANQRFSYVFTPTTRGDLAPEPPQSYDSAAIRVRLSARSRDAVDATRARIRARTAQRATELVGVPTYDLAAPERYYPSVPFRASPLPWAPVDLTPSTSRTKERAIVRVRASTSSPIAGR